MLRLVLLLACCALPSFLYAQFSVRGTVRDAESGLPLTGVSVLTESQTGITTDTNGRFVLTLSAPQTLQLSFVGYQPRRIAVTATDTLLRLQLVPVALSLPEVIVRGYESNRTLPETAGSVGVLNTRALRRFSDASLVPAVNTLPGVRMEERAAGSYRLAIRGSQLRSPFGIRNVKFYWNGIPFSEPNGNTNLSLLDLSALDRMEILKGPAGSLYGAGTGGTVLLSSRQQAPLGVQVGVNALGGSYGTWRYGAEVTSGYENGLVQAQVQRQQSQGYRQQNAFDRTFANVWSRFEVSKARTLSANVYYSDLYYEIPGGLTRQQYESDPQQARAGSVDTKAALLNKTLGVGLIQEYRWNDHWQNTTSVYGTLTQFENPVIFNYKINAEQALGGRSVFTYRNEWLPGYDWSLVAGGELQHGFEASDTYENVGGQPDSLRYNDKVTTMTYLFFGQAELELPAAFRLTAALSYNRLDYRFLRLFDRLDGDLFNTHRSFRPVVSPRVALFKKLHERLSVYGSVSHGFSPPTLAEVLVPGGSLNDSLQAEQGLNYEVGVKASPAEGWYLELTAFRLNLQEALVSYTGADGITRFRNTGATRQQGIEGLITYQYQDFGRWVEGLNTSLAYTFHHFRYGAYVQEGQNYEGKFLPGVPQQGVALTLDFRVRGGWYLNSTFSHVGRIPLDDANQDYADPYTVVSARLGWRYNRARWYEAHFFVGGDNLMNQRYSLGNDINAAFGRYFQPAAPVSFYAGTSFRLK
ncbi:iron complex outermembrane recepter protein [Catalinimonas alkaloidigena]|uniref:Iron complex outermembrane recepter protein n=1 Tax=Catalinimonas alkaloidigena TaxID=1075417 RepID=A0A1G9QDY7_9BACT|nr:TonB-dependent receptor [Catalinimonas alkaloidigena]SDM08545.1 iron complex outermembrane recepter protein [Catalinimonas alkaloidigena]